VKIIRVETLISRGSYPRSAHWSRTRREIHQAARSCSAPPCTGKKRDEGKGILPAKSGFLNRLEKRGWAIRGPAKNALGKKLGGFDAVTQDPEGPAVVGWQTGNISSSHFSLNKIASLLSLGTIAAGTLIIPLRVGDIEELESCFTLWRSVPCENGVLEIVVIEWDAAESLRSI
jgi:hypothetical protein